MISLRFLLASHLVDEHSTRRRVDVDFEVAGSLYQI